MEIIPVIPRGYCKGVTQAIALARKTARENPGVPITMLGMIVHNRYVVDALQLDHIRCVEQAGKTRLELLDEVNEGIVIFTAHGISEEVAEKARQKSLTCVDASCSDVKETQRLVRQAIDEGADVLYIGKRNHPEAEAVLAISPRVHPVYDQDSLAALSLDNSKILVTNQTTMSVLEIGRLMDQIRVRYPHARFEKEICNATRIRQEAIQKLENVDLLIVVGDPQSNNSNKLKDIAIQSGIPEVLLIETVRQLNPQDYLGRERIAVTSGASTPTYLTQQVIGYLNEVAQGNTPEYPDIELDKLL
ncbi:4-hydroxy-3-methylbut-2-enyl diphosphate reductase [Holdemania filiformis]|uniref:4-hydroxy-3-methylbut-2-enyl diphosphate reductase n=1 Tax=Holdemania filiformis TaxID=61171 RepID=UPI0026763EF7|nr:4-hydroxy-3-methylbut-2-enyl diphosphate reductase [Holdemania filiformis]